MRAVQVHLWLISLIAAAIVGADLVEGTSPALWLIVVVLCDVGIGITISLALATERIVAAIEKASRE